MALREVVPAATVPLRLAAPEHAGRSVTLTTVLPIGWPGLIRQDGSILLALQVPARSGDVSRDLARVLEEALAAPPGSPVLPAGLPEPGQRLQDLLDPAMPFAVTLHRGFEYWLEGADLSTLDPEVHASLERANAAVVPTARLEAVEAAYWCRMSERSHLRWVLPQDEEPLLDGLARMTVDGGLGLGEGTRYVGSFRAHGLLVPVWDLPRDWEAEACEGPARDFAARLEQALADEDPLSDAARRARGGLLGRQITLR